MRRGLTLRKNGATAICAPAAGSDPGPEFCHLNHLASASATASRPHPSRPRQSPEPCPLVVPCPARLFPTRLAGSVRAGIWNMAQNFLISTRPSSRGGKTVSPLAPSLLMCLQRGGTGRLIIRLGEKGRQLAVSEGDGMSDPSRDVVMCRCASRGRHAEGHNPVGVVCAAYSARA